MIGVVRYHLTADQVGMLGTAAIPCLNGSRSVQDPTGFARCGEQPERVKKQQKNERDGEILLDGGPGGRFARAWSATCLDESLEAIAQNNSCSLFVDGPLGKLIVATMPGTIVMFHTEVALLWPS
ncbi:unnamed protein product [Polarella glacialis]|uniref:Uncharacterized protein n=1 Tax=Polarella glacialis TaxID=89957 RepID=A0A813DIT3_POLGL|nr:unnamed protein product [Polarella glacialis]